MNKKTKIAFLFLSLVVIVVCLFLLRGTCNSTNQQSAKKIISIKNKQLKYNVDKGGTVHAKRQVAISDVYALADWYQFRIDSLTDLLQNKIKPKAVQSLTFVGTTTSGTIDAEPKINNATDYYTADCPKDTLKFKDKWTDIKAYKDSNWQVKYTVKDSLNIIHYWKKSKWYKPKELFVNTFSYNPNTTITGLHSLHVPMHKPKRFGLGVQIGYSFIRGQWRPVFSAGVNYNLIRF